MVDAVLLDWEGVLADTASARRDALLDALRTDGVDFDATRFDESCAGLDVESASHRALSMAGRDDLVLADLVAVRARRTFAERIGKGINLTPGARSFAERVSVGSRAAVVTSASRLETAFLLRLAGLEAAMTTVVASDDQPDGAPSARGYHKAIEQLGRVRPLRPGHVVAVVSSLAAIRAARTSGIRVLAAFLPAHIAVEADGVIASLETTSLDDIARAAGIASVEHHP